MILPNIRTNSKIETDLDFVDPRLIKDLGSNGSHPHTEETFPLRNLRIEKQLTQRELSKLLKLSRSQYQRLESKTANKFTVGEIQEIADCLLMPTEELVRKFASYAQARVIKSDLDKAVFTVQWTDGVKISSFCEKPDQYFMGMLYMKPQASLKEDMCPKAQEIFYTVMQGEIVISASGKNHLLRKGSYLSLKYVLDYQIYNPNPMMESQILIAATPSFINL